VNQETEIYDVIVAGAGMGGLQIMRRLQESIYVEILYFLDKEFRALL